MLCFKCKLVFNDPKELIIHIKRIHKICGNNCEAQCTSCGSSFTNFSTFKSHVVNCFAKTPAEENIDPETYHCSVDEDVCNFEQNLKKAALELVCSLSSNMRSPRGEIFITIAEFKKTYISKIISGIKEIVSPCVRPEKEEIVDQFMTVLESSFYDVRSEEALDSVLIGLNLFSPLTTCDVFEIENKDQKKPRRKRRKQGEDSVFGVDGAIPRKRRKEVEDSEEETTEEQNENDEDVITKGKVILMPIEFQMKKFLELPNVFEKIKLNTSNILQGNKLDHFIKGTLWKEKLKNYQPDQLVIPFHFYGDGVQVNNPLGPHHWEQQLNYYSFPTIPYEYQSRLENIFVAQLYSAKYHQQFSTEKLYNNIIDIFTTLAEDGVLININGEEFKVFFVLGLFIADNKEHNQRLGFVRSFVGLHCCRYCRMHLDDIRTCATSQGEIKRNRENYDEDVALDNVTATGVHEYSPFNRIPFFHVTESSGVDLAHDLTEGVLHTSQAKSISYFIEKKYFSLDYFNEKMSSMDFGEAQNGNRPIPITKAHLKKGYFQMTSSEMFFFTHHLTLIIGDRVPDDDPVWQHVLTTLKFFDLCYLPSYDQEDINALLVESEKMSQGLIDLFDLNLKHKSHLGSHYTELTEKYGPLRYIQTIRFEGKHKEIKSYAKNTNSRVNLPYSVAKKTQYNFALRLLQCQGLEDRISLPNYAMGSMEKKVYYSRLPPSTQLTEMSQRECYFANKVVVNGIIFSTDLWLPNVIDNQGMSIRSLVDIVLLEQNDITKIFAVCKTYTGVTFDEHYGCYRVDMKSLQEELSLINIQEFLKIHHYPVKIQHIEDNYLCRCKRF